MNQLVSGLRFRLLLLVVLASTPLVGLTLHSAWEDRQRQVADWEQRAQEMMQLATREEKKIIGQTRQLLLAVAESTQLHTGNRRDCKKLVDDLFASYPRYADLWVIKTNGELLASALMPAEPARPAEFEHGAGRLVAKSPQPSASADYASRQSFKRALETRTFAIGDFPTESTNQKTTIDFSQPVFDSSGQILAVVFATLELDWLDRLESQFLAQLPKESSWIETDRKGGILVHYPESKKRSGQVFTNESLLKTCFSRDHGVVEALDSAGVPTFYAFATLRSQLVQDQVATILGIPREVLFEDVNRRLSRNLSGLAVAVGLVFMVGWIGSRYLVLRPVEALVHSSARLAAGDLSARTGLKSSGGELGQLTRTFDQMAQTLEQREIERQRAEKALKASEVRYRRLFETAQDGILILDADTGQIDDVNSSLTSLLGCPREQLLGKKLQEIESFKSILASRPEFNSLLHGTGVHLEDLSLETCDGRHISVEFVSNIYLVEDRKVIQCHIHDISERKRAEANLRLQSSALEAAANAILITDKSGTVLWTNSAFTKLTGYSAEEVRGSNMRLLKSDQHSPAFYQNLWQTILSGQVWRAEITNRHKDGHLYTEDNTITPVLDARGEITHFVSVKQDITKRKQAEEKLTEYSNHLQILSRRLVEAQETERRNIARELHDEIGQSLTVAQMNLQALLQTPGTDVLKPRLNESLKVIDCVLEQVHDISLDLLPSMLDDLGLEPALRWYANRQAGLLGLRADIRVDPLEQRLDPVIETACFRIAQEALTNVTRHAQAHTVTVELRRKNGHLHLHVRDDGVGFDVAAIRKQAAGGASLGLLNMEERAVLADGGLEYKSKPGKGAEVHAWFPLKWQAPPP